MSHRKRFKFDFVKMSYYLFYLKGKLQNPKEISKSKTEKRLRDLRKFWIRGSYSYLIKSFKAPKI